ncbi:DNA replication protein psf2 [Thecaphora frezii]
MALPSILQGGPLPSELDFYTTTSSTTSISIVPLLSIDRVRLLTGIYGPFKPPQPATVPLWLALYLRNKKKALIIPPEWMSVVALTEALRHETTNPGFAPLPFEWIGVSNAILRYASEDVREAGKVRGLLKDIREARQSKVLMGVGMVNSVHLEMTGISMHEIAELRPFFTTAFLHLKSLQPSSAAASSAALDEFDASFPSASASSLDPPPQWQTQSQSQPSTSARYTHDSADPSSSMLPLSAPDRNEESMQSNLTLAEDESMASELHPPEPRWNAARGRVSNVSDSGYATATRPRTKQTEEQAARRPPRFDVDDDETLNDGSMQSY